MTDQLQDDFADVPLGMREVARKHGRDRFIVVANKLMVQGAVAVLTVIVEKHHSRGGGEAVAALSAGVNALMAGLMMQHGWTADEMRACEEDYLAAARAQILVAKSPIILPN